MNNLCRTFAAALSSPSAGKWVLHPAVVLQSSLYTTTSTKQRYSRKSKPEPSSSESKDLGLPTAPNTTKENITSWARPSEIPWQAKVANSVNLIGSVGMPVQFQASPDGKYWAGTVITQEKTSDFPNLWIPIIFEGDLAHIAACHLKEKDLVYIGGQLSADPPQFTIEQGQANVQVLVHSMNFVQESSQGKKIYPHKKDEWAFNSGKTKDDISVKKSWNDLLAKPHEWWDNRLNKSNPTGAAFEHKESGQLLWINESTPGWIRATLDLLTFDYKTMQKSQKGRMVKDEESGDNYWRELVNNPEQWRDFRKKKLNGLVNPKHPDFKHKDGDQSLWLNSAPVWVLSKLEGLEFDVKIHKTKQDKKELEEESWKNLVENPDKWWDNRLDKRNIKAPDFKHKDTGEVLWLNSSPAWVLPKLPPIKSKKDVAVSYRDTILS